MSEENAVATAPENVTVAGAIDIEALFTDEGQQALKNRWNTLDEREQAVRTRMDQRQEFCEQRGLNLERAVQFAIDRSQDSQPHVGAVPPVDTGKLTKEGNFVVKIAADRAGDGFTMEELPGLAEKAGLGNMSSKEARQPLLQAVLALDQQGVLKKADFKRDNKTVYVLAAPQEQTKAG